MRPSYYRGDLSLSYCVRHTSAITATWFLVFFMAVAVNASTFPKKMILLRGTADTTRNIFIKVVVSKSKVYVGEAFTVQYLLYSAVDVVDPQTQVKIKVKDSYLEEYPEEKQTRQVLMNGKPYRVTSLKKLLVIPQSVGDLTIPAISKELKTTVAPGPDDFFGTERSVMKKYASIATVIKVLPLPAENNKVPFSGAVGQFTVGATFTQQKNTHLLAVKISVAGAGNIKFNISPQALPPGVDLFDANLNSAHKLTETGTRAGSELSFGLATNYRGNYLIPPATFRYFDPVSSKYVVISTPPFKWHVPDGPAISGAILNKNGKNAGAFLYIVTKGDDLGAPTILYALLLVLSGLFFFIGVLNDKRKKARINNPAHYNYINAERNILKKIKKLKAANLDDDTFSKEITSGLIQYLNDKTYADYGDLPLVSPGADTLKPYFSEAIRLQIEAFLKEQTAARFSEQVGGMVDRDAISEKLIQIVKQIKTGKHA